MKSLELKHLAPYLPYGLKFNADNQQWQLTSINYIDPNFPIWANNYWDESTLKHYPLINLKDNSCGRGFTVEEVKPILRPLSDLTKEIEHNSISIKLEPELESVIPMLLINKYYHYTIREDGYFSYHIGDGTCIGSLYHSVPYELIQLLLEWHFDVFGLIEKGLAIDINKLEETK